MDEERTEAPQWEPELLEEAFLNLFPNSGPFSTDFGMPVSSPWQDYSLFLDSGMTQYDITSGGFENISTVEDHIIDRLSTEHIDFTPTQNTIPSPDILDGIASEHSTHSQTLSVESAYPVAATPKNTDFQACLHEFDGGPKNISPRRKRKPFSNERRKEVSQLRKVGACIRCRLTKSSVSFLIATI
jgi:hypothetical protein